MSVPRHVSRAIDITRGLAALGVIWGHAIYAMPLPLALNGAFWVWVFLPLSGYLVARSFDTGGYARTLTGSLHFLWNRLLRLVPLAELALFVGLCVALSAGTVPSKVYQQFLFIPEHNLMSLAGPLWTVAAELQFYVLAIVLLPVMRRICDLGAIAGLAAWALAIYLSSQWITAIGDNASQPRTLVGNLGFFVFGIVLAQARGPLRRIPIWVKSGVIAAAVATAWYLENFHSDYFWAWGSHRAWPFGGAALCALIITLVVVRTETPAPKARVLVALSSALQWCGFYTYGIYVAHSVLAATNNVIWHLSPGWTLLAVLLLAVPIAPVTYLSFERFWLRLKVDRPARVRPALLEGIS